MALANVALTDTFDTWRVRTNQIIIALDQANTASYSGINTSTQGFVKANSANVLAYNTSIGANNWANTVGVAGNNYASILAANNAVGANTWANTVGTAGNNYASILAANNAVGANNWANTVGS